MNQSKIKRGEKLWEEDDCTGGLPGHVTVHDKWQELFGVDLDVRCAVEKEDLGDTFLYRMPNDHVAMLSYDGWAIYEGGK